MIKQSILIISCIIIFLFPGCLDGGEETTTTTLLVTTSSTSTITETTIKSSTTTQPYWMIYIGSGNLTLNVSWNMTGNVSNITNISLLNISNISNISNGSGIPGEIKCTNASVCGETQIVYGCRRVYLEIGGDTYIGEVIEKYQSDPICRYPGTERSRCEYLPVRITIADICYQKMMVCDLDQQKCVYPKTDAACLYIEDKYLCFVQERHNVPCECGNNAIEKDPSCGEECELPDTEDNKNCLQDMEGCCASGVPGCEGYDSHMWWKRSDDKGFCTRNCKCRFDKVNVPKCEVGKCGAECGRYHPCSGNLTCNQDTCLCE